MIFLENQSLTMLILFVTIIFSSLTLFQFIKNGKMMEEKSNEDKIKKQTNNEDFKSIEVSNSLNGFYDGHFEIPDGEVFITLIFSQKKETVSYSISLVKRLDLINIKNMMEGDIVYDVLEYASPESVKIDFKDYLDIQECQLNISGSASFSVYDRKVSYSKKDNRGNTKFFKILGDLYYSPSDKGLTLDTELEDGQIVNFKLVKK